MVEMAALVPLYLREDIRDIFGTSTSFSHFVLLENEPKAAKIEEETWWRAYWTDAKVEKAAIRQKGSNRTGDPYDSCTCAVHELCAKMNSNYCIYDMAASFDRGRYHQRQFNK